MSNCEMGDCCGGVCGACKADTVRAEANRYAMDAGYAKSESHIRAWLEGYFRGLEDGKK